MTKGSSPNRRELLLTALAAATVPAGSLAMLGLGGIGRASLDALPDDICRTLASIGTPVIPAGPPRKLRLTWNANAICTVAVPAAEQTGLFRKYNLDVELINFGGSTDQLLEAIATGNTNALRL